MNGDRPQRSVRGKRQPAAASIIVPRSLLTAFLIVIGIWLSDASVLLSTVSIPLTAGLLFTSWVSARRQFPRMEMLSLLLSLIGFGASLWTVGNGVEDGRDIGLLASEKRVDADTAVRLVAVVANIPALDSVADSQSSRPQQPRTLCLVNARSLMQGDAPLPVRGLCRVLIEGDATGRLNWGDRVELTGQLDLAKPPLNPGEFDYAQHLKRCGISALMFLKHPAAAKVVESVPWWHPTLWLTSFRQQTVRLLESHLSPGNRATAEALLLGNRGHLTPDLERDFISSGTMHLLAISGLHVGILYVFLVRLLNLLLIPRTRALMLAGLVCVLYACLTDLRPSVLRATVFILLHIVGQVLYRELRMGSLIGATILILIVFDPSIAFDIGAWLSFLAVGALGWVSERTPIREDRPAPQDAPLWQDRLRDAGARLREKVGLSYRQMLAVTMLSAPLVATQFHLVSLTGMTINILLIPFTSVTLITGYLFVGLGLALPPAAVVFGGPFEWMLSALNWAVALSADVRFGFVSIPDLPGWFLPTYYALLLSSAMASRPLVRQSLRLVLVTLVAIQFWIVCRTPDSIGLTCTVLSVGHGNAVVVETPDDRVLLFDAGAMNRGQRTADLITRFLWSKGHRMIDTIVISHPDMDHYNAVAGLLERMPVGQVVMTTEFVHAQAQEVVRVMDAVAALGIPASLATHGDSIRLADSRIQFFKSDVCEPDGSRDNETSLVALLEYRNVRICLPGDLEGEGQQQLTSALPECQFVLSPHHGSLHSNTPAFAEALWPTTVAVSSRDDHSRDRLQAIYSDASVLCTSQCGAISLHVSAGGETTIETFASPEDR